MLIAKYENDKLIVADYRNMFPNTSFSDSGPSKEWLESNECYSVNSFLPYDHATQKLDAVEPYLKDGEVFTICVVDKSEEDIEKDKETKALDVRAERNRKLKECDWTQLEDAPVNKSEWAIYRQQLRDITNQSSFPYDVEWPEQPV